MFNVLPYIGFNVQPDAGLPGFRVGRPEDRLGLRIDQNGSVSRTFGAGSDVPMVEYNSGNARQTTSLPLGNPGGASSWRSRDPFGATAYLAENPYGQLKLGNLRARSHRHLRTTLALYLKWGQGMIATRHGKNVMYDASRKP